MSIEENDPMRVVIVGGGTAGWMAAAALSKYFADKLKITLVESDAIGTVGVGEATIPQIRLFNEALGLGERAFLRATKGTIKLGIEFVDWMKPGTRYFHGFGDLGRAIGLVPFYHYWLRYLSEGGSQGLVDFNPNEMAAKLGLYGASRTAKMARLPASAYHFDAVLYAGVLKNYAMARGVTRIEGKVQACDRDPESGFISTLKLDSGVQVAGDLFVDCSGFRGLLIEETLSSGFEDWSHWLPCDRAWAVPSAGNGALDPFTRSTARTAGWQWQIPLQHRTGNGHVYASGFIDDDAAQETLLENLPGAPLDAPRQLRFTTGKRREIWKDNCVSLGLASGFLEPLESTSIHLVQSGIARLVSLFPDRSFAPSLAAEFNRQMDFEFAAIRDFLILHYRVTERDDSEFWRYCRNMDIPDSLQEKLELFQASGRIVRFNTELFDVPSWFQVMWGQGLRPRTYHPMVDAAPGSDLNRYIQMIARETKDQVAALGPHSDFITKATGGGE